jgi:4'-phosphopantetheinyl transferase
MIKISIQYLDDISWVDAASHHYCINNNVDVWRINISANLAHREAFLALMEPDEIIRAGRYFNANDRNRFIVCRGALRSILANYLGQPPHSIQFETGTNKKPYIKNNTKLCYNISHSGDWAMLAISNAEIGADTELINNAYGYKDVLQDNFSTAEINYINQSLSIRRFFTLWTRKEALTKATGKGLDEDIKLIPSLDGSHHIQGNVIASHNNWLINTFGLHEGYLASVACSEKTEVIKFWDIYF